MKTKLILLSTLLTLSSCLSDIYKVDVKPLAVEKPTTNTAETPIAPSLWSGVKLLGESLKHVTPFGSAIDKDGNLFVTGITNADLSGSVVGNPDMFLLKYNRDGALIWTRQLGVSGSYLDVNGVAVDTSGNVFVVGNSYADMYVGGLAGVVDAFVVKYDTAGTKLWTKQLGVTSASTRANAVAVDSSGNVIVTGNTNGVLPSGSLPANTLYGGPDIFIAKFLNSTGALVWANQIGVSGNLTNGYGAAADSLGNVYVSGSTTGAINGNPHTAGTDYVIAQYTSAGALVWLKQEGIASAQQSFAVTVDKSNHLYVVGETSSSFDGVLAGTKDYFLARYEVDGTRTWIRQGGVTGSFTRATAVGADSDGNVAITGFTNGAFEGTIVATYDIWTAKYDSAGVRKWIHEINFVGAATQSLGRGVVMNTSGDVIVAGSAQSNFLTYTLTGQKDSIVMMYSKDGVLK